MMSMILLHALRDTGGITSDGFSVLTGSWSFDPGIVIAIPVMGALYSIGVGRLWSSAGRSHGVSAWQVASFATGTFILVIALLSPVDGLADRLQFMHMVQHLLLIMIVPPLLILGQPFRVLVWALPKRIRSERLSSILSSSFVAGPARFLSTPIVAFALHAVALVIWHLPGPYDAAVANDALHSLEHLSFLGTAVLFWWVVMAPSPMRRLAPATRVPYVFAMSLIGGAIGAVLTFASSPLYHSYAITAPLFGLSALDDQQLAGLIMWVPGGIAYLAAVSILFVMMLESKPELSDDRVSLRAFRASS